MKRLLFAIAAYLISTVAAAAVNLNTATKDELIALPGIGPAKAQAIVDYRNQHGPFKSIEEIRKVKGIGEKLFAQIKPELNLGAGKAPALQPGKGDAKGEKGQVKGQNAGASAKDEKARK